MPGHCPSRGRRAPQRAGTGRPAGDGAPPWGTAATRAAPRDRSPSTDGDGAQAKAERPDPAGQHPTVRGHRQQPVHLPRLADVQRGRVEHRRHDPPVSSGLRGPPAAGGAGRTSARQAVQRRPCSRPAGEPAIGLRARDVGVSGEPTTPCAPLTGAGHEARTRSTATAAARCGTGVAPERQGALKRQSPIGLDPRHRVRHREQRGGPPRIRSRQFTAPGPRQGSRHAKKIGTSTSNYSSRQPASGSQATTARRRGHVHAGRAQLQRQPRPRATAAHRRRLRRTRRGHGCGCGCGCGCT